MKKKLFFVMGAMLLTMAGTVMTACSSNDEVVTPETPATPHPTRQMPKQANFIKTMTDVGYLMCDQVDNSWYIKADYHGPEIHYDGGNIFYLYDLPEEFQKEGLKVNATLDCYTFRHFDEFVEVTMFAGYDYYDAVLKEIKIVE
jgi:hypothetical protein